MVEKLKPCPFCGGEAIICGNNEHNNRTWVMCKACHACPGGDVPSLAVAVAAWNRRSTLSDAVAEREAEPVGHPRIMYVCEYCQEHNPEMCGHDRVDLYVLPDGRWLCEGCIDDEGVSSSDCVSPPLLYTSPPTSELEALRKRVAELEKALEPFARHIDEMKFDIDNKGNPLPDDQAVGWVYVTNGDFRAARRVLEGGKVE